MMNYLTILLLITILTPWLSMPIFLNLTTIFLLLLLTQANQTPLFLTLYILSPTPLLLSLLTLWTSNLMLMNSYKVKMYNKQPKKFLSLVMILTVALLLTFTSNSLIKFFIMFESSLIPTLLLILIWGYQPERLKAGMYLMMYTMFGSLPLLISILLLALTSSYVSMFMKFYKHFTISPLLALFLLMAFLIKLPLYLVHLWLPKAHVEAPVAGSMILASVLLKLGVYGMIQMIHLIPHILFSFSTTMVTLGMMGAVSTSILCLRQHDLKELVAYASVSHMSFLAAAIYTHSIWATSAIIMMSIAHGLTSSMLFSLTNILYESWHTRAVLIMKSVLMFNTSMALWWLIALVANGGGPPFLNLLSEMLMAMIILHFSLLTSLPLAFILFFSMVYSLFCYMNITQGAPSSSISMLTVTNNYMKSSLFHSLPLLIMVIIGQSMKM